LAQRILPPSNSDVPQDLSTPKETVQQAAGGGAASPELHTLPKEVHSEDAKAGYESTQTLTLPGAIDTAFRLQPRLRVYLESVEQARRGEDIAFAPFLPLAVAGYSVGGFDLNAGGNSVPLGPLPGFTFLPGLGSIPFGLDIHTGYELAEIKLQWLICDF